MHPTSHRSWLRRPRSCRKSKKGGSNHRAKNRICARLTQKSVPRDKNSSEISQLNKKWAFLGCRNIIEQLFLQYWFSIFICYIQINFLQGRSTFGFDVCVVLFLWHGYHSMWVVASQWIGNCLSQSWQFQNCAVQNTLHQTVRARNMKMDDSHLFAKLVFFNDLI